MVKTVILDAERVDGHTPSAKQLEAYEALYAVPSEHLQLAWLLQNPQIIDSFREFLSGTTEPTKKLTACALFARLCKIECPAEPAKLQGGQCQPHSSKADKDGVLDILYDVLPQQLEVRRCIA